MGENVLARLTDTGNSRAQMELAHWYIHQWQQGDHATDEPVPQNILDLLEKAAENRTEARRLLGQVARRKGDTAEAKRHLRSALDGGDYTVLPELAEVLHPSSPEDARQLALSGLQADGSPCPPW
jgi:lipopolysaccharide biosynthesis regulator YciM